MMEAHPAAGIFPLMGEEELKALAADIREHGQRHPIVRDGDGLIVDGRNRLAACELAGVEPRFEDVNGSDALALVVSLNVKRRNLTAAQRAIAAAEAWDQVAVKNDRRRDVLAVMFDVSTGYVQQARALVERDPAGAEQVKAGVVSLREAYDDLMRRDGRARSQVSDLQRLRAEHPDLAEAVGSDVLELREALERAEERAEEERKLRYAATMNVIDGLRLLEQPSSPDDAARAAALIDEDMAAARGEKITPERLRQVATFTSALADAIERGQT